MRGARPGSTYPEQPLSSPGEIVWLQEHHPDLLERALRIERNAQAKLRSVKGLGRSFSWESNLRQRDDLPLFDCRDGYSPPHSGS